MLTIIPVRTDGINPIEYVKPYLAQFSDDDIAILLGTVMLLKKVKFSLLSSLLNIKEIVVEEMLGRIMATDLWEGNFSRNYFELTGINHQILQQEVKFNLEENTILAYLKARFTVTIGELQKTFSMNYESVMHYLSKFIAWGIISIDFENEDQFNVIVYYKLPRKEASEIDIHEKQIVGFASLKKATTIKEISTELEIPEHLIQINLMELILADMVLCRFNVSFGKFRSFTIEVSIKHFQIPFETRPISMMSTQEKMIIGVVSLQGAIEIKELENLLKLKRSEVLKIISTLNATKDFLFEMKGSNIIIPVNMPILPTNIRVEDIDQNSLINYRSLLGLIKAKNQIRIDEIADRMNISTNHVIKGLVDLFLNGLIMGKLILMKKFKLETLKNVTGEYVTLEDWEKIVIGGLLVEENNVISMAKLGTILSLNKDKTHEFALSFISRNIGETEITNAFLKLKSPIKIPPLVQLSNLDLIDQQLYCLLIANKEVNLRRLRSLFSMSNKEIYMRIYYVVGSGLCTIKNDRQNFTITSHQKFYPVDPIENLDFDLRSLIVNIEQQQKSPIKLSKLADILEWEIDAVDLDLSYLIGHGYYEGYIKGRKFYKTSNLFKFKDKPKCFECHEPLDNFREPCPKCYSEPPKCSVCRSAMNTSEDIVACPHCANSSHIEHIKSWLALKSFCPICRNRLKTNELMIINNPE